MAVSRWFLERPDPFKPSAATGVVLRAAVGGRAFALLWARARKPAAARLL